MTTVSDGVLQWLHNSLRPEYHDVNRSYSDVVKVLSQYSSLTPRTEVFTYDNGVSALLLRLDGTLPVNFRGTTYRFPIAVWIPQSYPREPPMPYVVPTQDMAVRPSQYISAEGKMYHPYLANWGDHWHRSSMIDLLAIIQEVFAKEPPVIAKQQRAYTQQSQTSIPSGHISNPPPIPPNPQIEQYRKQSQSSGAPPPPPKSAEGRQHPGPSYQHAPLSVMSSVPAVPPKPGDPQRYSNGAMAQPRRQLGTSTTFQPSHQQAWTALQQDIAPIVRSFSPQSINPRSTTQSATSPSLYTDSFRHMSLNEPDFQSAPRQHGVHQRIPPQRGPPQPYPYGHNPTNSSYQQQPPSQAPLPPQTRAEQLPTPKPRQPIEDLLSAPLENPLPSQMRADPSISAPPVPLNPEKDSLLQSISQALQSQLSHAISQNQTAFPALEAQRGALQQCNRNMQSELGQLKQLDSMLDTNERVLRETMREADRLMDSVSNKERPNVDEVLVAPTTVGEQLYNLVAEEKSIADTMFILTRALDKGRVGGDVFLKQTRSLAREQFLKKALIKKIAKGMGLAYDY